MTPTDRATLEWIQSVEGLRFNSRVAKTMPVHPRIESLVSRGLVREDWSSIGELGENVGYLLTKEGRRVLASTCELCAREKRAYQRFCGAVCSAKWEMGLR